MCQCDFTRGGVCPATYNRNMTGCVVRRAKGMFNFGRQGDVLERVYLRYCDCLFGGRIRQKVGCGFGEERILWWPAIAIVSARLARDCPLMSSRHGDGGLVFGGVWAFSLGVVKFTVTLWWFMMPLRLSSSSWRELTPMRRIPGTRLAWLRLSTGR